MEAYSEEIKEILMSAVATWEVVRQHHLHVGSGEDWLADLEALTCDEEHGHHDQCGVVVPASPPADLVLAEPTLLLSIFQRAFDEVALSLHVSQPLDRGFRSGIRQGVFEPVRLPRNDQMPLVTVLVAFLIQPHSAMKDVDFHRPLRSSPGLDALPCVSALGGDPCVGPHSFGSLVDRRIGGPDVLIAVDVADEPEAGSFEHSQELTIVAIEPIEPDPREPHAVRERSFDQIQSQLLFAPVGLK